MLDAIGAIIKTAREREGTTLEDLASRSGAPLDALRALEQGRPGITTMQLDDIATALALDARALVLGRRVSRPRPSVFLRHLALQDFDDHDGPMLDQALHQAVALGGLAEGLAQAPSPLAAATFAQRAAAADQADAPALDGYGLAQEVRRWLGNEGSPLGDLRALVEERFGIAVLVRDLASTRVAAASVRAEAAAAIVLSARAAEQPGNALVMRVDLSHELCHVLFDPSEGGLHIVVDLVLDRKDHAAEQRARAFAAEFLLPLAGLTRLLGVPGAVEAPSSALALVARARSHFGTPHDIAANHLCNRGFVHRSLRPWLEAERTTFDGPPPPMTLPEARAASRFLAEQVERAYRKDLVTDGEARATLGLDRLARLPWDEVEL